MDSIIYNDFGQQETKLWRTGVTGVKISALRSEDPDKADMGQLLLNNEGRGHFKVPERPSRIPFNHQEPHNGY